MQLKTSRITSLPIGCKLCLLLLLLPGYTLATTNVLQLPQSHSFQFAGYYAALEKGYYQNTGLHIVIQESSSEKTPISAVQLGLAQYGVANSEILVERLQGKPLVILAAIFQHSPAVLMVRKDSGIQSPRDLVGRKVLLPEETMNADFTTMLKQQGG